MIQPVHILRLENGDELKMVYITAFDFLVAPESMWFQKTDYRSHIEDVCGQRYVVWEHE